MSWLFSKTLLKWREPRKAWRILQSQELSRIKFAKIMLIIFLSLITIWFLAKLNPSKKPIPFSDAVGMSMTGAIILNGVHWLMLWFAPSDIRITANSVLRIIGNTQRNWKYSNIKCYSFDILHLDSNSFVILVLQNHKGQKWKIALNDSIDKDKLEVIFNEHKISKLEQIP